jgi:curved DNA-binding protein CbpA
MARLTTYYDTLRVARSASKAAIKAAYRSLSQKVHPDKNLDDRERAEREMKRINEAYAVLSASQRRAAYDAEVDRLEAELAGKDAAAQRAAQEFAQEAHRRAAAQRAAEQARDRERHAQAARARQQAESAQRECRERESFSRMDSRASTTHGEPPRSRINEHGRSGFSTGTRPQKATKPGASSQAADSAGFDLNRN